ncbi:zinc-ribbon domain-containing protein [Intestinimonas butyriciproducens]|uniref:zinc-ribbon domain-containing protein n=1 Tax=Intestinimonas butyriciproducens TaxID=1297617 RepID=UPI00195726A6|nr:zinc-ribbon domain-containing protein [Intestinimonas butyriciproducens]MBM6919304.1 zinc-ribbon domain-containing protein [Intestinimonas butyriciproducens]
MRETLDTYCIRTGNQTLLDQWDSQQNDPYTPQTVTYGSKKKMWWRCKEGHAWKASIYTRTGSGTGCPYCAGKLPLPGKTDLVACFPHLAAQWHPTKNLPLTPRQVLPGSHRIVWWVCERGHTWKAQIKSRVMGCGCPVCSNREVLSGSNDLASQYPQLARQWHPTRNGHLSPDRIAPGTRRKVWWVCEKGHEWQASVVSRTSGGSGCPVCTGKRIIPGENDLASLFPDIAAQWHPTRNGKLSPREFAPGSNHKIWWICSLGHSYTASVASRTMRSCGCPYCAGRKVLPGFNDLASTEPQIALQWHPGLNGSLTPEMVTSGTRRKVWWQCPEGHVWKAAVYSRTGTQKCGCPICAGRIGRRRRNCYENVSADRKGVMQI